MHKLKLKLFDKKAKAREFKQGDKVLLYLPLNKRSLKTKYFGPYVVNKKVSTTGYITDILENLDQSLKHLGAKQKNELSTLIRDHASLFPDYLSVTTMVVHDVVLEDHTTPVKQPPYRLNPAKREILKKGINFLMKQNIIEPSTSAWASPVILILKQDRSFRLCVDLQRVNQLIKADSYPLPRLHDCIDVVGHAHFIAKIDLLKGYYAIPLTKHAQEVLAIITPNGLFQFKVMPFGLKTAPSAFQRMMNNLLSDMTHVSVYLDDVVLASTTWEEHLSDLKQIFVCLQNANVTINLAKCEFSKATVTFLGHTVSHGLVAPQLAKTLYISDYPAPTNRRAVRRFLGMAGYYRRFCPNFAMIAASITNLLKKDVTFKWTEECNKAFKLLKGMLSSKPVMTASDYQLPF